MDDLRLDFEPFVGGDVRRHIIDGISNHNMAATGAVAYYPANFVLRSARGEVMGGLLVLTGILFLASTMTLISGWMLEWFPGLSTIG